MARLSRLGILGLLALLAAAPASAAELTVSAAASLKAPLSEIAALYEARHPGMRVVLNFAASGLLRNQIENGAPVDVFASASAREMDLLDRRGQVAPGTRRGLAGNRIVLAVPAGRKAGIASFGQLKSPAVGRIAIGNPATVPAGTYAAETLRSLGLWDAVKTRLVYGENVRQVADYVARGEVDAGVVFATDAAARPGDLTVVADAPDRSHSPVVYVIAAVRGRPHASAALEFIGFACSAEGRRILASHGFRGLP